MRVERIPKIPETPSGRHACPVKKNYVSRDEKEEVNKLVQEFGVVCCRLERYTD